MLLQSYSKEMFRPKCNPEFQSMHCIAHLDQDVGAALPYLNAVLGGDTFLSDPPSLTLQVHGRLITIHAREIALNALKDEAQADQILNWLQSEINRVWEERESIEPRFTGRDKPQVFRILMLLPRSNCQACGQPTCMVFAAQLAEGGRGPEECPELDPDALEALRSYLAGFDLDM